MRTSALTALSESIADGEGLLCSIGGPFRRAVRRHPRRGTLEQWRELQAVPWSETGFFHAADQDPGGNLDYHTGSAYPQDAASQVPTQLLAVNPGEVVIDLCAAPGSKSTQLAHRLGDSGVLVCCDRSTPRRQVLSENLARQGVSCALVTPMVPELLAERHPQAADAVLLDAPCSGHEDRSDRQVARMAQRQHALLKDAARLVRAGGRLVYSTCTPYRQENEDVVERFLATHAGWVVRPAAISGCDGDLHSLGGVRLWPQRQGSEPFFACCLVAPGRGVAAGFPGQAPPTERDLPTAVAAIAGACGLLAWRRGEAVMLGTPAVAQCALPSESRGLLVLHHGHQVPWGAQGLIERGLPTQSIDRTLALSLWSGAGSDLPPGTAVCTTAGGPVGIIAAGGRLDMPSRMYRRDVI